MMAPKDRVLDWSRAPNMKFVPIPVASAKGRLRKSHKQGNKRADDSTCNRNCLLGDNQPVYICKGYRIPETNDAPGCTTST